MIQVSANHVNTFGLGVGLTVWHTGIIMLTTQLLSLFLRKLQQPRVIAEVLGGIFRPLAPLHSADGCIPGFTQHVIPLPSMPYLTLVANIGLILFLFLISLEINGRAIKVCPHTSVVQVLIVLQHNAKLSLILVLPRPG